VRQTKASENSVHDCKKVRSSESITIPKTPRNPGCSKWITRNPHCSWQPDCCWP
jgi:hypothetical protein